MLITGKYRFSWAATAVLAAAVLSSGAAKPRPRKPVSLRCGDPLAFQVRLDRQRFSPGQIDGQLGANLSRALRAAQEARGLSITGNPDCDTWRALGGDTAEMPTTAYTITAADVKGPFTERIPSDLVQQAELPQLEYSSVVEALAERFHSAPALLQRLNRGVRFGEGADIQVPSVTPFDPTAKPAVDPAARDITIQVSRDESAVRAIQGGGTLAFFAPVSSGTAKDPLPPGNWKVTSVNWRPVFHYNPDLFWDAKPAHTRATLKSGPNNPVGVVWIGLDLEHYGMHGTPEPGRVGYTQSHGCVRLTNWDAARLASLVQPGTPVVFK